MEVLVPTEIAVTPLSTASLGARRVLLISEDEALLGVATAHGWLTRRMEVAEFLAEGGGRKTMVAVTELAPELLVFAVGFSHPISPDGIGQVKRYASAALTLTAELLRARRSISIVGVRRPEAMLPTLFDGVLLTAMHETAELEYAAVVAEGRPSAALMQAIEAIATGAELRYRFDGNTLWAEHFRPMKHQPKTLPAIQCGGHYLVLGGGGGVGVSLVQWLTRSQGAVVSVVGRSPLTTTLRERLSASGALGYAAADASDPDQLEEVWEQLARRRGRVQGVFHLAGAIDDALILAPRKVDIDHVFDSKVGAALNLWRAQSRHATDFICNFTSLSGRLGNAGQASYAAANAFVDSLTVNRDSEKGICWRAINWGLWESDGMSISPEISALTPMRPAEACQALEKALCGQDPISIVFSGALPLAARRKARGSETTLSTQIIDTVDGHREPALSTELIPTPMATVTPVPSREAIGKWVAQVVSRFSGLRNLGYDDNLIALGVDSVTGIKIANEIGRRLAECNEKRVSKALIFEYPTISELVDHLISRFVLDIGETEAEFVVARTAEADTITYGNADSVPPMVSNNTGSKRLPRPPLRDQDIAIVGIAGEFPGADSLEQLWRNLRDGVNAITVVPEDRWSWREEFSAELDESGKTYGRHGGFIGRAKQFDPAFFGISPAEASMIDPQERRFLQTAYHALEDACHFALNETETGMFVAAMFNHYQDLERPQGVFGGSLASIANRASYAFNLQGPSMCVDTMCSGSLSALHLAMNSIRLGECKQALVGAANIMPHPGKMRFLAEQRFLSRTGRCHSFGVEADGYVPGEGVVAMLIKPINDAIAQGDRIHAVIRGCAVNHGGRSSGYTVPSIRAQERVIRSALAQACVEPEQVGYIEAHGTGTSLGDPIEIEAIAAAYSGNAQCVIGSVKSNIGHLESAAGLAGLAKIVLQFQHETIFPTLNCRLENPLIDLAGKGLKLAHRTQPWKRDEMGRFASLSSFGAGGANAHVVVADYAHSERDIPASRPCLIVLSGKTTKALDRRVADLAEWLSSNPYAPLYAVGYTLARSREHFKYRRAMVVSTLEELRVRLLQPADIASVASASADIELASIQRAYLNHEAVAFAEFFPKPALLPLPHYPFDEKTYWALAASQGAKREPTTPAVSEDLLESNQLLFGPQWHPEPLPPSPHVHEGRVLVFCSQEHVSTWSSVADVITITLGSVTQLGERSAVIHGHTEEEFSLVLNRYASTSPGVVMCVNMLGIATVPLGLKFLARTQFALAKALGARSGDHRMVYVHPDAVGADEDSSAAALAGLFRVLAMEEEGFGAVAVELAKPFDAKAIATIMAELVTCDNGYRACRYVADQRQVRYLRELAPQYNDRTSFRKGGVYLVTGGLGMIGRAIAERLINDYQATVVLTGRSPRDAVIEQKLSQLRSLGGTVDYRNVDVTDEPSVTALIASLLAEHGGLHGIIHSAGLLSDSLLRTKTVGDFERVLDVKVAGTRLLDQASAHIPLDFFVMFSSISSLFGNVGQADYVTANSYLDGFAVLRSRRVARGQRYGSSKTINWPLWIDDDGEMDGHRALAHYMEANFGISSLDIQRGVDLFVDMLRTADDVTQVAPLIGDVDRMRHNVPKMTVTLANADLKPPRSEESRVNAVHGLERLLSAMVCALTGLDPDEIDLDTNFGNLGLNSIALQKMSDRIGCELGFPLPPSALFSHNSLTKLARHLHDRGASANGTDVHEGAAKSGSSPVAAVHRFERSMTGELSDGAEFGRIAIIGMDGRLPGSEDLDGFWRDLVANRNCISPMERWPHVQRWGGTVPGIDEFDAKFFGISAREAVLMDPQHRLFLQASYNALLNAGYAPSALRRVGVFAGVQFNDYEKLLQRSGQAHHPYMATGNAHAMLANRVSYLFDFEGPSQTVDTACSSALVAINRAVLALRTYECDYAVAGAVSLLLDSETTDAASSMGVLSPRAKCSTFDENADGYVRAEGVGCVILKRLEDAVRDGDSICAVIESFAENHGGRANSLTAPNPHAQARLLRAAYTRELAARVSYIETHGTGTKLGDPVEIDALKAAWADLGPEGEVGRIQLGSVKTNVGHLEPAAGIASLLKVILCLKHRFLPANINFERLNPYIELAGSPFKVLTENSRWASAIPRVAGISSFGFGGTNAHLVLSEPELPAISCSDAGEPELIVLSAKSVASLLRMKERLLRYCGNLETPLPPLADVAMTLYDGREHFKHRLAWVVTDMNDLVDQLRSTDSTKVNSVGGQRERQRGATSRPLEKVVNRSEMLVSMRDAYLSGETQSVGSYPCVNSCRRVPLPGYAFDNRRYWFDGESSHRGNATLVSTETSRNELSSLQDGKGNNI